MKVLFTLFISLLFLSACAKPTEDYLKQRLGEYHKTEDYLKQWLDEYHKIDTEEDAAILFEKNCDSGYTGGCYSLGLAYQYGRGVPEDYIKAIGFYEKTCLAGNILGCFRLAVIYDDDENVHRDSTKAMEFYGKTCAGSRSNSLKGVMAASCNRLGVIYASELFEVDYNKALELYDKACDMGYQPGCRNYLRLKRMLEQ